MTNDDRCTATIQGIALIIAAIAVTYAMYF